MLMLSLTCFPAKSRKNQGERGEGETRGLPNQRGALYYDYYDYCSQAVLDSCVNYSIYYLTNLADFMLERKKEKKKEGGGNNYEDTGKILRGEGVLLFGKGKKKGGNIIAKGGFAPEAHAYTHSTHHTYP